MLINENKSAKILEVASSILNICSKTIELMTTERLRQD